MNISPNREALRSLATFSVDEEFCQKFGGKVFGYAGVPTPAYRQLCYDYALLLDRMASSLIVLKSLIPVFEDHGGDKLGNHLGEVLENERENSLGAYQL